MKKQVFMLFILITTMFSILASGSYAVSAPASCEQQTACYNDAGKPYCSSEDETCAYITFDAECHAVTETDSDGDGWTDTCDAFPLDASEWLDLDGDGYGHNADCDDLNININPGFEEICGDGIDQNCDGRDEVCISDGDGDGVRDDEDNCPDTYNPLQEDSNENGIGDLCEDKDADGKTLNNDCDDADSERWRTGSFYRDSDLDGYPGSEAEEICYGSEMPEGYVETGAVTNMDCDDTDENIHPFASEVCGNNLDDDCDGSVDEDCDEQAAISPSASSRSGGNSYRRSGSWNRCEPKWECSSDCEKGTIDCIDLNNCPYELNKPDKPDCPAEERSAEESEAEMVLLPERSAGTPEGGVQIERGALKGTSRKELNLQRPTKNIPYLGNAVKTLESGTKLSLLGTLFAGALLLLALIVFIPRKRDDED